VASSADEPQFFVITKSGLNSSVTFGENLTPQFKLASDRFVSFGETQVTHLLRSLLQRSVDIPVIGKLPLGKAYVGACLSLACLMATSPTVEKTTSTGIEMASPQFCRADSPHENGVQCDGEVCAIPRVDPVRYAQAQQGMRLVQEAPQFPLTQTFQLHSRPTASHIIYLDFDGHLTAGTAWNTLPDPDVPLINTVGYSLDVSTAFSNAELTEVQAIWQRVAECFSPFDVDVTTESPSIDRLIKSGTSDTQWGIRVVFGESTPDPAPGAGGVAFLGSFNWDTDTPCFVYTNRQYADTKVLADAAIHEVGHTLGLRHDGRLSPPEAYYLGHGFGLTGWAPHMGAGYYRNLVQWSKGEYNAANNQEDDLAIIVNPANNGFGAANGFGYRADDFPDTTALALPIAGTSVSGVFNVNQPGVIEKGTDVDMFKIVTKGGPIVLYAVGGVENTMLDIQLDLYNSSGTLVVSSNPTSDVAANINQTVTAGTYYLKVDGVGAGTVLGTGYSDYGSLGTYRLSGTYTERPAPPPTVNSNVTVAYSSALKKLTLTGDGNSNTVTVTYKNGKILVEGSNGTKINNSSKFPPVTHAGPLSIVGVMGNGDDSVSVIGVESSTTDLNLGSGADKVAITFSRVQTLKVNGGPGIDSLLTTSSTITNPPILTSVP
jgi:Metallo-peptidase family M12B Reprolysin-like